MLAPLAALLAAATLASPGRPPARGTAREAPFVVVLDPGHGGDQDGALSPAGLKEKDLTLDIARRVAAALKPQGVRVVLTRPGDLAVPLANRPAIANAIHADLFISIHLNSMPTAEQRAHTSGVESYFLSASATDAHATAVAARENADRLAGEELSDPSDPVAAILSDLADAESLAGSSRLAYDLHERLVAALGVQDHGVKQAPFHVLAGARMPAVLLELGFISNPDDSARLVTRGYQERIAAAVAEGVRAWRQETRQARR
jgi:N-acetylmuramoyl-L-alanine amidase